MLVERWELRCPSCDDIQRYGLQDIVALLTSQGKLRKDKDPPWELLEELFRSAAASLSCGECGRTGLGVSREDDLEDEEWGAPRRCEVCGQPIPAERMEVFPDTRVCVSCKVGDEHRPVDDEPQYCSHCGAVLQMKLSSGSGISRYRMACLECGNRAQS